MKNNDLMTPIPRDKPLHIDRKFMGCLKVIPRSPLSQNHSKENQHE